MREGGGRREREGGREGGRKGEKREVEGRVYSWFGFVHNVNRGVKGLLQQMVGICTFQFCIATMLHHILNTECKTNSDQWGDHHVPLLLLTGVISVMRGWLSVCETLYWRRLNSLATLSITTAANSSLSINIHV